MPAPGSADLGRGVIVTAGEAVPGPWDGAEIVAVDEAVLAAPGAAVTRLHRAWSERRPVVVVLSVDPARFRQPDGVADQPWELDARFELWSDRLHFLVWANNYDARGGVAPVWWWARKAIRLGAVEHAGGGPGDVTLPDGTRAWIDGGPRGPLDPDVLGAPIVHREAVEAGILRIDPGPVPVRADLAPDQLAAVAHGAGPARIIAPAGSGKTRVLTERLRHLHVDRGVERASVLAVAYNKKAQQEMEARTVDFRPRVSTLNALGLRLLTEHAGRPPRVLDERDVRALVDQLAPSRPRRANTDPVAPYLEALAAVRLGLRDPEEVEAERDDVPGLAELFGPYRRALARTGSVDFDEQIYGALELLLSDGPFRRRVQAGHRHLLVDELQDLTPAHVLLVRLLAAPGFDVFGVGDDDQVIYGHAGADPAYLIDFAQLFPGAASHPLEVNYRCPVAVVDAARTLLGYNHRRVDKVIRPGPDADRDPGALVVRRHRPEAGASELVDVVQTWLSDDGVTPADVTVLTRVNSLLLAPHVALLEAGIPVSSLLSPEVLERTGVRAALAYLRLGAAPEHMAPADLQEVQRRPSRGFPQWIAKWLGRPMSLDQLRAVADRIDDEKVATKVLGFADDLAIVARAVATGTTRQVLTVVADQVGLGRAMSLLDGSKGGQAGSQLDDLEALVQVADLHADPLTFEQWLRGVLRRRATEGGVTLSTVHRVKGMEWDRVVVAGVTDGILPHRLAADEEEERRVLHVAITRARHLAVVLADDSRPSPFLGELDGSAPRRPSRPSAVAPTTAPRAKGVKRSAVEARVGLGLEANGGFAGTVAEVGDSGVQLALDTGGKLVVRYGESVTVRGRTVTLVAPPDLPPEVLAAEDALRAWRLERARADKVSAFIVASNAVLRAVATRRPATLEELAGIDGIGPTKLENYGEEILAVLESVGR